ncbi:MAG: P-II family nitrogen regulator [Ruminococcus sp.]|nr:P-II family nitrogen regulator [Ruminococcus sp.]
MQAIFLVFKQTELLDSIMDALSDAGIRGGTAIDSEGMARSLQRSNKNVAMVELLRGILSGEDESHPSKTLFVIVKDEQVDAVRKAITSVTGDLSKPNAGIMFGVPISFTEGIS